MVTKKLKYFEFGSHSNKGSIKESNYDGYAAFESPNGHVFLMCDGINEFGAKAKDIVIERIEYFLNKEVVNDPREAVQSALIYAGGYIHSYAKKQEKNDEIGISCLCVLIRNNKIFYAWVGNCNLFLYTGKNLHVLTEPTFLSENNTKTDDLQKLQLLGKEKIPSPYVCERPITPLNNDIILLCTDGLYEKVNHKNIKKILSDPMPIYTKACRLSDMALKAGGEDNITLQLISFYNLDHKNRDFAPASESKQDDELPKITKGIFMENPLWNSVIIGVIILLTGFMFYDLFFNNVKPQKDITPEREIYIEKEAEEQKLKKEKEETSKISENISFIIDRYLPSDSAYVVQSGDSWSNIYSKFKVCSWFIINYDKNKRKFDRNDNPVSGRKIYIPLKYSANEDINPYFYQYFSTDVVGSRCQHASEKIIRDFDKALKEKTKKISD